MREEEEEEEEVQREKSGERGMQREGGEVSLVYTGRVVMGKSMLQHPGRENHKNIYG